MHVVPLLVLYARQTRLPMTAILVQCDSQFLQSIASNDNDLRIVNCTHLREQSDKPAVSIQHTHHNYTVCYATNVFVCACPPSVPAHSLMSHRLWTPSSLPSAATLQYKSSTCTATSHNMWRLGHPDSHHGDTTWCALHLIADSLHDVIARYHTRCEAHVVPSYEY